MRLAYLFLCLISKPLVALFSLFEDLPHAERIGIDRPRRFERFLMAVLPYRDIVKGVLVDIIPEELGGRAWDVVPTLYMRRFYLTPTWFPVRLFLHHIVMSDNDPDPHTHPWNFCTAILKGAYVEELGYAPRSEDFRFAGPGTVLSNEANHLHKVEVLEPVWSLVAAGRAEQRWGFETARGWVDSDTYLGLPYASKQWAEDVIR